MTMISPRKKQWAFQLNLLLSSDRIDRLKLSLVSLVCIENDAYHFCVPELKETLDSSVSQGIISAHHKVNPAFTAFDQFI